MEDMSFPSSGSWKEVAVSYFQFDLNEHMDMQSHIQRTDPGPSWCSTANAELFKWFGRDTHLVTHTGHGYNVPA